MRLLTQFVHQPMAFIGKQYRQPMNKRCVTKISHFSDERYPFHLIDIMLLNKHST